MAEITVIVPVYNVEKYLSRCVDSILNQSFTDFELILVDDGSPDRCGEICDIFAEKDKRIKVIHQNNRGLPGARNSGTKIASGIYISYIDSDDYVEKDYLQILYSLIKKHNADISIASFFPFDDVSSNIDSTETVYYSGRDAVENIGKQHSYKFRTSCAKLLKTQIAKMIPFPERLKSGEDFATTYKWLFMAKRVVDTNIQIYHYNRENTNSITHQFQLKNLDELKVDEMLTFFQEYGFYDNLRIYAEELVIRTAIYINNVQKFFPEKKSILRFLRRKLRHEIKKYGNVIGLERSSQKAFIMRNAYPIKKMLQKKCKHFFVYFRRLFHA